SCRTETARRRRDGTARIPATGHGCLLSGYPGPSDRDRRQEPAVQEDQGEPRRLHEGSALLHADRRKLLRQLSARQNAQGLSSRTEQGTSPGSARAIPGRRATGRLAMNRTAEVVATVGVAMAALTSASRRAGWASVPPPQNMRRSLRN